MAGGLGRSRFQALLCRWRYSHSSSSSLSGVLERPFRTCSGSRRRMASGVDTEAAKADAVRKQLEAAAREDRLDFFTAAKILFSTPPKPKTFGLDFHLWQFFMALLPPFAVYLTAQYSRYEMRRMEKERDDAEELKLQAALAEELAARTADEESKFAELSSTSIPQRYSPGTQQEQNSDSKLKNKDEAVVMLPEKDFLAIKARLDAMEDKVKLLESVRPGATFIIPLESEADPQRVSTKENTEKPVVAQATDQAEGEKQENESALEVQNQKDVDVPQGSGRSWFGFRSKPKEKALSE